MRFSPEAPSRRRRGVAAFVVTVATTVTLAASGCEFSNHRDTDPPPAAAATFPTAAATAPLPAPPTKSGGQAEPELPAQFAGQPRLDQARSPKVSEVVGAYNALAAKSFTRSQTAVFGPNSEDQSSMTFVTVASAGTKTPQAYVNSLNPEGTNPVDTTKAGLSGTFHCWEEAPSAKAPFRMCAWGDDKHFMTTGSSARFISTQQLITNFVALNKQLFGS